MHSSGEASAAVCHSSDQGLGTSTSTPDAIATGDLRTLDGFTVTRVLSDDALSKTLVVLGRFNGSEQQAVVLLSRRAFDKSGAASLLSSSTTLYRDFVNDIYSKYAGQPAPEHSVINVDLIYPATDKHIQKYSTQRKRMVTETPSMYRERVLPYIQAIPTNRLHWVYNILEGKAETDRLLYEAPGDATGFMLHPDLKWDQSQVDQLYCLALVRRRDLASLRDLTQAHLPLLLNIRDQGGKVIEERFGVPSDQLRLYLHYPPSYYHLHVHFTHLNWQGAGALAGKAVLLDDVIDNLRELGSDYYQRRTMTFVVGEAEDLWKVFSG